MQKEFGMVVFDSTHTAITCAELFEKRDIKSRVLTTPGVISAGCGLSIHFSTQDLEAVKQLISGQQVEIRDIYLATKTGVKIEYQKIESGS